MANINNAFPVGFGLSLDDNVGIFCGENDPSVNNEVAPIGSLYLRYSGGSSGELWLKTGVNDSDWILVSPLFATNIDLTGGYVAINGTVAADESVELAISKLDGNQLDLTTLTGVPQGSEDLGSFTGGLISDDLTIKEALQEVEDELESLSPPGVARTTTSESINVGPYTAIRQNTSGITTTLTGATDGKRLRIHNASGGDCIIGATVSGVSNPIIYNLETFDMEYHETEGEWVI